MSNVKILMLIIVINVFLYLAGFHLFDNDILDRFVQFNPDGTISDYAEGTAGASLKSSVPESPTASGTIESTLNSFSFVYALAIVWSFIKFLLNIMFAPIGIFVSAGMPIIVQLGVGLPIGIAYIYGLIALIRGVSS